MIRTLLKTPTQNVVIQLFRYLLVGGVAFAVDFGLLWGLTERCGVHYLFAAALSFVAGLTVNYVLSIRWVFSEHALRSRAVEFSLFALIGVVGLGWNEAIIWLATECLRCHYMASKVIAAVVVFFWNFLARKYLLFYGEMRK